jgi:hypothetical protein
MIRPSPAQLSVVILLVAACGGSSNPGFGGDGGGGGGGGDDGSSFGDSGGNGGGGPPLIYAHTDSELYSMDPATHQLTDIGPFDDGSGSAPTITDLAVDGSGNVWVNSETAVYRATIPAGTGTVSIAMHTQLQTGTKFYALGFTPAGMLQTGESLVAGDSAGDLYFVDVTQSSAVPLDLGGFGSASNGKWELSGDVVFYSLGGAPRGLATIRQCSPSCSTKDDSLAEIDVAAMQQAYQSKTPAASLLKQLVGNGTGFGDLFGIGAWNSSVYAFSRASGGNSAQLVQIGSAGTGTALQQFPNITAGWSGAGVTTKASVTVVK